MVFRSLSGPIRRFKAAEQNGPLSTTAKILSVAHTPGAMGPRHGTLFWAHSLWQDLLESPPLLHDEGIRFNLRVSPARKRLLIGHAPPESALIFWAISLESRGHLQSSSSRVIAELEN